MLREELGFAEMEEMLNKRADKKQSEKQKEKNTCQGVK